MAPKSKKTGQKAGAKYRDDTKLSSQPEHLFFPLIFLDDPPEDHQPDQVAVNKWRMVEWKAIVDYHGYGFAYDLPLKVIKTDLINVFRKISFHTQGVTLARCAGDVGPGLLKDGTLARLGLAVPAAQWTVTEANIRNYFDIPGYLLSAPVPKVKRDNNPVTIKPTSGSPIVTFANSNQGHGNLTAPQNSASQPPDTQENSGSAPSSSSSPEVTLLAETVKQGPIDSTYSSLQRHEASFPLQPRQFLDAAEHDHLREAVKFSHHATAAVGLRWNDGETQCVLNTNGSKHTYHGKGPVWSNNSCWIDSVIVAGMLLQAGSTIADRGGEKDWEQSLDAYGRMYLDTLNMDWTSFDRQASIAHRDLFRKFYTDQYNKERNRGIEPLKMDSLHGAASFWADVTGSFHQFRFRGESWNRCACRPGEIAKSEPRWVKSISPPGIPSEDRTTSMQTLMQASFITTRRCRQCREHTRSTHEVVHGGLPLRLVVELDTAPRNGMPTGHTDDIRFEYERLPTGTEETVRSIAAYRWLGGVYYSPNRHHFRVYWADHERGQPDLNTIRVYDGMMAEGAIIGNFRISNNKSDKLDREWTARPANLLFYERIMFPTSDALQAVGKTVADVRTAKANGDFSLIRRTQAIGPRKQEIYRRSLQPYIIKDAEYRATRMLGAKKVPPKLKDLPPPPTKATTSIPQQGVLPTPPQTSPSKTGVQHNNPVSGNAGDSIMIQDSDDEKMVPTPTPARTNTDVNKSSNVATGSAGDGIVISDSDDEQMPNAAVAPTNAKVHGPGSVTSGFRVVGSDGPDADPEQRTPLPTRGPTNQGQPVPNDISKGDDGNSFPHVPESDDTPRTPPPAPSPTNADSPILMNFDSDSPLQSLREQTQAPQGTQGIKRNEPDSGHDESDRSKKQPASNDRSRDVITTNVAQPTTGDGNEPDVLDMSQEKLDDFFAIKL